MSGKGRDYFNGIQGVAKLALRVPGIRFCCPKEGQMAKKRPEIPGKPHFTDLKGVAADAFLAKCFGQT